MVGIGAEAVGVKLLVVATEFSGGTGILGVGILLTGTQFSFGGVSAVLSEGIGISTTSTLTGVQVLSFFSSFLGVELVVVTVVVVEVVDGIVGGFS